MRRAIAVTGFAALLGMVVGATPASASNGVPNFQHMFVIMMENTGFDSLIGNPNALFINEVAANDGLAMNYFGVTHPSQPNYIAATAGVQGNDSDSPEVLSNLNIVDQVEASGRSWKAYMQAYSQCVGDVLQLSSCGNQLYERKHNPFISFADVRSSTARLANIVDFGQFSSDLASGNVANYVWISPDQCHDMHGRFSSTPASDPCAFQHVQGLISAGDTFLQSTVGAITSSSTWQNSNSVIFIMWDESDFTGTGFQMFGDDSGCCDSIPGEGGGHVVSLVISSRNDSMRRSGVAFNHYSLLSTIEHAWNLGCLGFTCDAPTVRPMVSLTGGDI
jgi:phospholipase C